MSHLTFFSPHELNACLAMVWKRSRDILRGEREGFFFFFFNPSLLLAEAIAVVRSEPSVFAACLEIGLFF